MKRTIISMTLIAGVAGVINCAMAEQTVQLSQNGGGNTSSITQIGSDRVPSNC